MVSDFFKSFRGRKIIKVLILVLMEYGLWLNEVNYIVASATVLILVLMEYGLWLCQGITFSITLEVS